MKVLAFIPLIREIVQLGQTIADNVRARRAARAAAKAAPCPPAKPTPQKQRPTQDGKR